jgi:hypothetical protein
MEIDAGTTFHEILQRVSEQYPQLVGDVIQPNLRALKSSNMLNLNGKHMIQPSQMDQSPEHGDRLILMSILAGG